MVTYTNASSFLGIRTGRIATSGCGTSYFHIFCTTCASYYDAYQSWMYPSSVNIGKITTVNITYDKSDLVKP